MKWRWYQGDATTVADFGNPVSGATAYHVCIYDDGALSTQLNAPAGGTCAAGLPCWTALSHGFEYIDKGLTPSGISRIKMREGTAGRATIQLQARGANMSLAAAASATQYFNDSSSVQVQLVRDDNGTCWETTHVPPNLRNIPNWFSDR